MAEINTDEFIMVGLAAKLLNKSRPTIHRWAKEGKIQSAVKIGRILLIPKSEIERIKNG